MDLISILPVIASGFNEIVRGYSERAGYDLWTDCESPGRATRRGLSAM